MNDVILEVVRAIPVVIIFAYLISFEKKFEYKEEGWRYIIAGFGLILFASVIDITDNFEVLNRFVVIGDTGVQAFLEKVVGYLGGYILLAMGFWKWTPKVAALKKTQYELEISQKKLQKNNVLLEKKVKIRTEELHKKNEELKNSMEEFYTMRVRMAEDMKNGQVDTENKKIRGRIDSL